MTPSLARWVLTRVDPMENNGSDVAPAIITRVWSDSLVNIRVMLDSAASPLWKTSVALFDTEEDAAREFTGHYAWWPPRVSA